MAPTLPRNEVFETHIPAWIEQATCPTIPSSLTHQFTNGPIPIMTHSYLKRVVLDCETDIESIDIVLNRLINKKEKLQRFTSMYKPFLAAHRRLPREIAQEIIMHCIDRGKERETITSNMNMIMRISWISKHCKWSCFTAFHKTDYGDRARSCHFNAFNVVDYSGNHE